MAINYNPLKRKFQLNLFEKKKKASSYYYLNFSSVHGSANLWKTVYFSPLFWSVAIIYNPLKRKFQLNLWWKKEQYSISYYQWFYQWRSIIIPRNGGFDWTYVWGRKKASISYFPNSAPVHLSANLWKTVYFSL